MKRWHCRAVTLGCHRDTMSTNTNSGELMMGGIYRLASLLSLLGDGFIASFPGFPLAGATAAAESMVTVAARLIGSSAFERSSGLG